MRILCGLISALYVSFGSATPVFVSTTSGLLQGSQTDGVSSFKGIRFAEPPTGALRWEPPIPFISTSLQNVTTLGPSCVQQFPFASSALDQFLFNNPSDPPPEDEDCLFLNVWVPSSPEQKLPVLFWIHGGALSFGTASLPLYDSTSIAKNQDIIVVTINYRTNVFGFPGSPDLPLAENNLGFLDQELALRWVQENIAKFNGDPDQVTIMGQSAGSQSQSDALKHLDQSEFSLFEPVVDNVTVFPDPLERIISEVAKDFLFLCPAELWSAATVGAGVPNVFRYTYGPVFADLQLFPGAGAWHTSELPEIFGTFNATTATAAEAVESDFFDFPCEALWNNLLDTTE
ncbi:Carboxylic ester hydrolase [Mycena sanguinolenta]|uniref:Carboxylic ester hydrolase n=1 Tax=Mycena sanguinolenta TaxID=230812 RepID=A0A8H6Z6E1_9AGAR|nr:Carboxylic ester hydrolase [Mycena sanguinolenta]